MEKTVKIIMLALALCALSYGVEGKDETEKASGSLSEVDRNLKLLRKPAVKTIKSEDGDLIDCVDIHKQPAFDHPALKNHKIQMKPRIEISGDATTQKPDPSRLAVSQTWKKSGSCPEGTVPIRRTTREELLRANSLEMYGRKNPAVPVPGNSTRFVYINGTKVTVSPSLENRTAAMLFAYGFNFIGASGDINVWNIFVEKAGEYTTGQIWLKDGPNQDFESIESGWVINPALYGDGKTRLFAYWTTNGYKSTGCFDLTCPGFVQTSQEIALGAAFDRTSSYRYQYFVNISINMEEETGNWWLRVENVSVGYWPKSLFGYLSQSATFAEFGGEVYSSNVRKTPHTRTAMGSGSSAESMFGWACHINHVHIVDYSKFSKYPEFVYTWADEQSCYSAFNYIEGRKMKETTNYPYPYDHEPVLFFGGPGQSWSCP